MPTDKGGQLRLMANWTRLAVKYKCCHFSGTSYLSNGLTLTSQQLFSFLSSDQRSTFDHFFNYFNMNFGDILLNNYSIISLITHHCIQDITSGSYLVFPINPEIK